MKKTFFSILIIIFSTMLYAQQDELVFEKRAKNNFTVNLFGDASIISANYERLFWIKPTFFITAKLGVGYNVEAIKLLDGSSINYLTIPLHATGNWGKGRHFFEAGLGSTVVHDKEQGFLLYPIIGYRLQGTDSKPTVFRVYLNVPFRSIENYEIISPIGIHLGFPF